MTLFGEQGFRGTSITAIERAAGLSPGAGGIYHHFRSKEALLTAGLERQLDRLDALRDIRRLMTGLGDLRAELTLAARYTLAELDSESQLLRILVSEARARPELVETAVDKLVRATQDEFAAWLAERGDPPLTEDRARAIASIGLGALTSTRLLRNVLGVEPAGVDDETFVNTWVEMMLGMLTPAD